MRFSVETWAPEYGASIETDDLVDASERVDATVEVALADATAELASEGAPSLESIFLDEGFGTLDPTTLDVVASAIEELGSAGRMVAVVTHIRELAERMPVRLEVTKVGASSRVERVDT